MTQHIINVVFVCMGNICRSPLAEGAFRDRVAAAGLGDRIKTDSAGTHAYHVGEPPDARAQKAASLRGFDISDLRARKFVAEDFNRFDYVIAMDDSNQRSLASMAPPRQLHRLHLMLEFASELREREVPDPYYGGYDGFERVLDLVELASDGLLDRLQDSASH